MIPFFFFGTSVRSARVSCTVSRHGRHGDGPPGGDGFAQRGVLEPGGLTECSRARFVTREPSDTHTHATSDPHRVSFPFLIRTSSQAAGKDWGNALKQGYREDPGIFCQSDDDEQLVLTIPFRQIVNLTSIAIQGPSDGTAPKTVKGK